MADNPYSRIVGLFRPDRNFAASVKLMLGQVTMLNPTQVKTAGITLPREALRINELLVRGVWPAAGADLTVDRLEPALKVGDQVLMVTDDGQIFYILAKVVNA